MSSDEVSSSRSEVAESRMSRRSSGEGVATESYPSRPSSEPRNRSGRRCFCCGSYEHLVRVCPIDQSSTRPEVPGERSQASGSSSQPSSEDVVMLSRGEETVVPR